MLEELLLIGVGRVGSSSSSSTLGFFLSSFAFLLRKGNLFCWSPHLFPGLIFVVMLHSVQLGPKWGQLPAHPPQQSWEPRIFYKHSILKASNFSLYSLGNLNCHQMQGVENKTCPGDFGRRHLLEGSCGYSKKGTDVRQSVLKSWLCHLPASGNGMPSLLVMKIKWHNWMKRHLVHWKATNKHKFATWGRGESLGFVARPSWLWMLALQIDSLILGDLLRLSEP